MRLLIFARPLLLTLFVFFFSSIALDAQTTVFTYQGRLTDTSMPASGVYDLQFTLYDESGTPIGATTARDDVTVTNGVFTVQLDFGAAAFPGANRVIEIAVRRGAETGAYTPLSPRQPVTSAPYAIRALSATNADNATTATNAQNLGGAAANQFVQTNSAAFIRNQTTPQTAANFNIDGTGAAGIFNAQTQYNILGSRVLGVRFDNLFVGVGAGNSFVLAGGNSFVGYNAGYANTSGSSNSFFGADAGRSNTTSNANSFFGRNAGSSNTTGIYNSFVGLSAGSANTTGDSNSFFGEGAGYANTTGSRNSFVGEGAGISNTTGAYNSFFGLYAGVSNTTGSSNTIIGYYARVGSGNLDHATAIGADAVVNASNSIVLGRIDGSDKVIVYGLGTAGQTGLCRNSAFQLAGCSSSLRYKTNIAPFSFGLNLVKQLRPISFDWKEGGMKDVGFGAEDVAKINPLFVNYNRAGEVEGVKYDRLSVAFVNAFKEQQTQIETQTAQAVKQQAQIDAQAKQLAEQKALIDALRALVCQTNARAAVCKGNE